MKKKLKSDGKHARCSGDNRIAQRFDFPTTVEFKLAGTEKWQKGTCINISGVGIRLVTKHALLPGTQVTTRLKTGGVHEKPLVVVCSVAWSKIMPDRAFVSGLAFIWKKREEQFVQFICDKMLEFSL